MLLVSAAPELDRHDTGPHHPERPARVGAALAGIADAGLSDAVVTLAPRRATTEELLRVHTAPYLLALEQFCAAGGGALDADTVVAEGSWDTALLAAGGGLAAIEALQEGMGDLAFVAARPPGHHATANRGMGFCLLNTVAVAAAALIDQGERVVVVDWDVHHGNGTQSVFWDESRVLYVSTHQWPLYPGSGRAEETGGPGALGLTVNVPVPPGTTGDVLLGALDDVIAPVVEEFSPTWVLVSAGFDAHRDDPLADMNLTAGDFADFMGRVRAFAPAPRRLVVVLEGGYALGALSRSVGAVLAAGLGVDYRPEPASAGGPGSDAVQAARRIREEHRASGR